MSDRPIRRREAALRLLTEGAAQAPDPKIMRIVALVDSMNERGSVDGLIQPLRQRLARLRPPRPLRFERLMFHPLGLLIVPAGRWRPNRHVIPRSAIAPLAEHVRRGIGSAATAIEAALVGRTTEDVE